MSKIRHFFTTWTKKKIIITAVAVIVLALFGWTMWSRAQAAAPKTTTFTRTTVLRKQNLSESVSVTGTVESTAVTNITSTASYKVKEILVQEGDHVTEGQVLAYLDTEELDKQISRQASSLSDAIKEAQKTYDDAVATRDKAYTTAVDYEPTVIDAKAKLASAEAEFNTAKTATAFYQSLYDDAVKAEQKAADEYTKALAARAANTDPALDAALDAEISRTDSLYATAQGNKTKAMTDLTEVQTTYNYTAVQKTYETAKSTYETARKTLDNYQASYDNAVKSVSNAADRLASAKKSDTLTDLKEKRENCVIKSTANGTITAVNATVGSMPAAAAMFVIQDTDHLRVAITIDEYDVKKIEANMKAVIKSDATGDAEISGYVSQVSLTATASQSGSGFGAEVTVSGKDSGLLIGMSAKVEIIISEKENVYYVPYDAVETKDGKHYVYVQNGTEFDATEVTTGMETDYYIEISGANVKEGMVIRSSADPAAATGESTLPAGMMFGMQGGPQMTSEMGGSNRMSGGGEMRVAGESRG